MDILKKSTDSHQGLPLSALPPDRQAEYLAAVAQRGATEALKAIGLSDATAAADIKDIRDMLQAMRILKHAAWTTSITALGRILGWVAVLALAALFLNGKTAKELASVIAP